MTNPKKPEARYFNEDYPVVIVYAHVTQTEAMTIAERDIGDIESDYGKCTSVSHEWCRYKKVNEDDLMGCDDGVEEGDTVMWMCGKKKPAGVVTKITVLEFE